MKNVLILICLFSFWDINAQTLSRRELRKMNRSASSIFKGQCPLERVDWMTVTEGYDRNQMIAIATEIQAAAKADATQIANIAEGNASANVKGEFSRKVNQLASKKVEVSKEFYEQYLAMRTPVCNIYQAVQQGMYNDNPEALKEAQKKFTEMNDAWFKYITEEQKKSQH